MILLSIVLKLAGVAFLCIAGIGVVRLSDPFQRMHAATKAGTLGAGLVILGTVVAQGATDATVIGLLTIVFLLLTVPVAGHLLGRAAYVSGAKLSLRGGNALDGVLERSARPLDERMGWLPAEEATTRAPAPLKPTPAPASEVGSLAALATVRFAVIDGQVEPVAGRARDIARRANADLSAHVIIDAHAVETAEDPVAVRKRVRERASHAIHEWRSTGEAVAAEAVLSYDEGDPERLLACADRGDVLLVLPCEGWFHHGVDARRTLTTWEPDGLLRLPGVHAGPVLFVAPRRAGSGPGTLVVRDCGEPHLPALVEWALFAGIWEVSRIVHVAPTEGGPVAEIARRFATAYVHRTSTGEDCAIPADLADANAVILGQTPRPLRTNWFGSHWRTRIAHGMAGDVLIMEAPRTPAG